MAQMAATAGGVAIGSTVGHVVGHALTGGGGQQQAPPQQAPPQQAYGEAPPQPLYAAPGQQMYAGDSPPSPSLENSPCGDHLKQLLTCTTTQPEISYCADISEALKQCRNYYGV